MKYRQGFVSNSSSSSFICKGYIIDTDRENLLKVLKETYPECIKEYMAEYDTDDLICEYFYYLWDKGIVLRNRDYSKNQFIIAKLIEDSGCEGYLSYNVIDCSDTDIAEVKELASKFSDCLECKVITDTRET